MFQGSKAAMKKSEIRILLKKREVSERINLDPSLPIKLTFKRDLSNIAQRKYTIRDSGTRNLWILINYMVLQEFQTFPRSIQGHQILTRNSRKT
jgi:hypothetical protein